MFTFEGNTYSLAQMLAVNADTDLREWLRTAERGDKFLGCECIAAPDEVEAVDSALGDLLGG